MQEIKDFKKYGNCLNLDLYRFYKQYLQEQLLNEFTPALLYSLYTNQDKKRTTTVQRIEQLKNIFKNIKTYDVTEGKRNATFQTRLQFDNQKPCSKQEFKDNFLKYQFNDQITAQKYLETILDLFTEDGWLKLQTD